MQEEIGPNKPFKLFTKAKCTRLCNKFNQNGTIVATFPGIRKILFDGDEVEGDLDLGQNLANAYWFKLDEIESLEENEDE